MKTITYTLEAEIEGLREDELEAGEKGAGEARKHFEQEIRRMKFTTESTTIRTVSLTVNE